MVSRKVKVLKNAKILITVSSIQANSTTIGLKERVNMLLQNRATLTMANSKRDNQFVILYLFVVYPNEFKVLTSTVTKQENGDQE